MFDSLSFMDICDENQCDDLKGIPFDVFAKLHRELTRRRKNEAEDAAYLDKYGDATADGDADDVDDGYGDDDYDDDDVNGTDDAGAAGGDTNGIAAGDDAGGDDGAAAEGRPATSPQLRERATSVFQQFDTNGDGYLDESEYNKWAEDQGADQFDGFGYSEVGSSCCTAYVL